MWELICHHTYKLRGMAVDLSDADSHGYVKDTTFLSDGVAAGSGALRFQNTGHVFIPINRSWTKLGGLRIEVTARVFATKVYPAVFIRNNDSFIFYVADQELMAGYATSNPTVPGSNFESISAPRDPLFHHSSHMVPLGKWSRFEFEHDGIDKMLLRTDGQLVAEKRYLLSSVPGATDEGIFIGSGGNYSQHVLEGDIDEIKVWRLNPNLMEEQFFARPVDQNVADCWKRFFTALASAVDEHPDCRMVLDRAFMEAVDRLIRAILGMGPETRERFIKTSLEYRRLWQEGKLDGPEMEKLFSDWCMWLRLLGISLKDDSRLQELLQSECLRNILAKGARLDCDPQFATLLQVIASGCGLRSGKADLGTTSWPTNS